MSAFASISLVVGALFAAGGALALRAYFSSRNAVRGRAKIVGKIVKRIYLERRSQRIPVTRFEVEVPSGAGVTDRRPGGRGRLKKRKFST